MRRRCRSVWTVASLAIALAAAAPVSAESKPPIPTKDKIEESVESDPLAASARNLELGRGVNIIGYDRIWRSFENGRFKARHFRLIKEGGFDIKVDERMYIPGAKILCYNYWGSAVAG